MTGQTTNLSKGPGAVQGLVPFVAQRIEQGERPEEAVQSVIHEAKSRKRPPHSWEPGPPVRHNGIRRQRLDQWRDQLERLLDLLDSLDDDDRRTAIDAVRYALTHLEDA